MWEIDPGEMIMNSSWIRNCTVHKTIKSPPMYCNVPKNIRWGHLLCTSACLSLDSDVTFKSRKFHLTDAFNQHLFKTKKLRFWVWITKLLDLFTGYHLYRTGPLHQSHHHLHHHHPAALHFAVFLLDNAISLHHPEECICNACATLPTA